MSFITRNRQGSFVLKALLLIFALHTSIGYAACCIALEPAETQTSMPCHESNQDTHVDHNECCSSCFAIGIPSTLTKVLSNSSKNITADIFILFISSSIDPLFRPPITLLS